MSLALHNSTSAPGRTWLPPGWRTILPAALLLTVTALGAVMASRSSADGVADSGGRVVLAGLLLTLLPGLVCGQVLGVRASHAFDAVARALMISLGVSLLLALAAFLLHLTIGGWVAAMLLWNAGWLLAWLAWPPARHRPGLIIDALRSIEGSGRGLTLALLASLLLLARGLYRWADSPVSVGWEVAVQLSYVRQYASRLPLDFELCSLRPEAGLLLPNLFFLWEFLLAGIARLSGVDPLIAATRSRWLVPALGIPAYFFMALQLLRSVEAARRAVAVTIVAVLLQFFFLKPAPLEYTGVTGPDRGVSAFWGTIHHSDTAMDVLLPLLVGLLFSFLRSGRMQHLLALAGLLVVSFFWHPREYFQVMWYGAVALLTSLLLTRFWTGRGLRSWVRRAALMSLTFAVVAFLLFRLSHALLPQSETVQAQLEVKQQYVDKLRDTAVLGGAYSLFNVPFQGYGAPLPSDPYVFSWLVLAALLLPAIAVAGTGAERWLSVYFVVLWWLTLCWFASQVLLMALSYSEILVTSMRLIYLFAYVLIGAGCTALVRAFFGLFRSASPSLAMAGVLVVSLALGCAFDGMWQSSVPRFATLRAVLGALVPLAALACAAASIPRLRRAARPFLGRLQPRRAAPSWLAPASAALLLLPAARPQAILFLDDLWTKRRLPELLLTDQNPLGLSQQTLFFLREHVPPRTRLLVDPRGNHLVGIYSPLYVLPYPQGYILADLRALELAREGRHPVFKPDAASLEVAEVASFLHENQVDFVLASGAYAATLMRFSEEYPDLLQVVFRDERGQNSILKVGARATAAPRERNP